MFILLAGFTSLSAQTQRGKASFYSKRATGARTASGERLHHDSLTCAHRYYPFGTLLKVTNLANDSEVIVKVTDRGPFGRGRIIDLSWRAAKELGILAQGVAMVKVEVYQEANGIPYKGSDNIELPELDFEITEAGYSYIDEWKERSQTPDLSGKMKPESKSKVTRKPSQKTKPATVKPDKAEKPKTTASAKKNEKEGNKWMDVFEKLKNWSGDIFK